MLVLDGHAHAHAHEADDGQARRSRTVNMRLGIKTASPLQLSWKKSLNEKMHRHCYVSERFLVAYHMLNRECLNERQAQLIFCSVRPRPHDIPDPDATNDYFG